MDNTIKPAGESKKKIFMILGLVAVVVIIVIAAVMSSKNKPGGDNNTANVDNKPAVEAPADAQPYVPEGAVTNAEGELAIPEVLKEASIVVVGANPIAKDGTVINSTGDEVQNNADAMSLQAPKQTPPIAKDNLPKSVIKLEVTAGGWNPREFTVKPGEPVTLAIISGDSLTHVFMFDDSSLSAVAVGVGPKETRAITFNAPDKAGEYSFHCDVPGHAARGETGKMIVK